MQSCRINHELFSLAGSAIADLPVWVDSLMSLRRCGVPGFGLSDIHAGRADAGRALDMLRKAIFKAAPAVATEGDLDAAVPAFLRELFEIRKSLTSVAPDECFLLFCRTLLESASEAKISWVKQVMSGIVRNILCMGSKEQHDSV